MQRDARLELPSYMHTYNKQTRREGLLIHNSYIWSIDGAQIQKSGSMHASSTGRSTRRSSRYRDLNIEYWEFLKFKINKIRKNGIEKSIRKNGVGKKKNFLQVCALIWLRIMQLQYKIRIRQTFTFFNQIYAVISCYGKY